MFSAEARTTRTRGLVCARIILHAPTRTDDKPMQQLVAICSNEALTQQRNGASLIYSGPWEPRAYLDDGGGALVGVPGSR